MPYQTIGIKLEVCFLGTIKAATTKRKLKGFRGLMTNKLEE
jgi:hypothetical protein